jgi:hypothetical protein
VAFIRKKGKAAALLTEANNKERKLTGEAARLLQ